MVWFFRNSYQYIAPRGLRAHVRFLWALPGAYIRFNRLGGHKQ